MSLLHCIPSLAGGGAERQLIYLVQGLLERGWAVSVATARKGQNCDRLSETGVKIHWIDARSSYHPSILSRLRRIVRNEEPNIVQTWLLQMDIAGGLAARVAGVPWILSERSSAHLYPGGLKYRLREALARGATAIVSNSEGGRAYWEARIGTRIPQRVIPNGLPLGEIKEVQSVRSEDVGLRDDDQVILFVGRRSPEKNIDALLLACRTVLKRDSRVVAFCGEGFAMDQEIRLFARDLPSNCVRVLGYIPDVWRWMKRASALVSVGFCEGRPNAVLEAMACGCPVVVSDIPAHREFLDETCAVLVNARDAISIARGLEQCLTDRHSASLRAGKARELVGQWTIERMVEHYEEFYAEVMGSNGRSGESPINHYRVRGV